MHDAAILSFVEEVMNEMFGDGAGIGYKEFGIRWKQAGKEAYKRHIQQGLPDTYFNKITKENLEIFRAFDLSDEELHKMQQNLSLEKFLQGSHDMVYDFLDCIGLTDFSFVAHDYISMEDGERFVVLNE